jgi:phospholipid/cholesterol/gamma-HCH transport system permease protein
MVRAAERSCLPDCVARPVRPAGTLAGVPAPAAGAPEPLLERFLGEMTSNGAGTMAPGDPRSTAGLSFRRADDQTIELELSGAWTFDDEVASAEEVEAQLASEPGVRRLIFDAQALGAWDSGLLVFVLQVIDLCARRRVEVVEDGLPLGARRLLSLAAAVPERKDSRKTEQRPGFLAYVGGAAVDLWRSTLEMLAFIGECAASLARLLAGKARFRRSDLFFTLQASGVQALPIVSLIAILVGVILAFTGAIQLKIFGAQIYVASLVGIAMVRVMGAVMSGIDALQTLGLHPIDFLVLPRMLALFVMMPLLCLYADLMGILGGFIVGVGLLDLGPVEYLDQTRASVKLNDLWIGLFHGAVFGVLIALAGCLRGMQSGRSASAVGDATTSAVVTSIVSIITATAIITVACDVLGI